MYALLLYAAALPYTSVGVRTTNTHPGPGTSLVTGAMVVKIADETIHTGMLRGSIRQGVIKARWLFSQEDIPDSIDVNFKLQGNKLIQQRYHLHTNTRIETMPYTSAFALEYMPLACLLPLQ
ncbi:hypothetical protein GA0116948_108138 [Chitinophaga costaii]|uniref:Uncharacterized protein n=1 Tax=Chitinophaga costaii TaxID=1335309 RepID=A0A1C4EID4_9BACT|nr:hypothetical protein [Chitinophaga costaii]PUZ23804.1 hypothetical protein DCM91_13470 [Chitinophaga costaii]SCC43347.1 hypothetical protein GA0116948_108138 [Chitinophaga costaii]